MKRDLYSDLVAWKNAQSHKPVLLRGARQTGKTWLLQEFGKREFEQVAYLNFEDDTSLGGFFERDLDPRRLVDEIGTYLGLRIRPGEVLLVFDEIQASNRALTSLKYFAERAPELHVAAAGSLLGVKASVPGSFPVGKVRFLDLHPLSFLEFLDARGMERYRHLLENLDEITPLTQPLHDQLVILLREYHFVGGMPEAVESHCSQVNASETREIQQAIVESYVLDFAKHAPGPDIPRLSEVWNSIPRHLARENRKFMFSAVRKGARAREYESALAWLRDAGLIHTCSAVQKASLPLDHFADRSCFKVFPLDIGLLGALAGTPIEMLVQGDRLFNEYEGAFVESYVAQQLVAGGEKNIYYWRSKGGRAELDFLVPMGPRIVPLEVKAGINPRSKSLQSYDAQFAPDVLARSNLLNLKKDGKIVNVPLYAVSQLFRLLGG